MQSTETTRTSLSLGDFQKGHESAAIPIHNDFPLSVL